MYYNSSFFLLKRLLVWAIIIPILAIGQTEGIRFESGLSWKSIQAKAKAENKYIFMDCYATWCGPCKWMAKNIYPEKEAGEYYNAHFINVAVQMDKTTRDASIIQDWYSDADSIAKLYHVDQYPTYLFFKPDGQIIHRFSGSAKDKMEFIAKGKEALDPAKQYYTLLDTYKTHKGDSAFLLEVLLNSINQEDFQRSVEIGDYYIDCLKDPLEKNNIKTIASLIQSTRRCEKGYKLFIGNAKEIDAIMGDSLYVESALASTIYQNEIDSLFQKEDRPFYWGRIKAGLKSKFTMLSPGLVDKVAFLFQLHIDRNIKDFIFKDTTLPKDWSAIVRQFKRKYPGYEVTPLILYWQSKFYAMKGMWAESMDAIYVRIHRYGYQMDDYDRNDIAWYYVFMHSNDKKILQETIKLMKRVTDFNLDRPLKPEQPNYIDTYANLLYKIGEKKEAMLWETKAIELQNRVIDQTMDIDNKRYFLTVLKDLRTRLETMQMGMPTWENNMPAG